MEPLPLSPSQYRLLVEHSPVMIWRSGLDARCDYVNGTWLAFTGRTLEQEVGEGWASGVHPDDADRRLEVHRSSFARREAFEVEYRLRRADGVYRHIFERAMPFKADDATFAGYIGSCMDVHERRESERQKAAFLSMIAQELRAPLTSMRAYVEGLRRRAGRGQPVEDPPVERLAAQVSRFGELVGEMNDAARLESGRPLPIDVAEVDLAGLARDVVGRHLERLRSEEGRAAPAGGSGRQHALVLEAAAGPAMVQGDRRRLDQVLSSLLDNAVKYSPDGGTVRVTLARRGDEHAMSISDEGIGVPPGEIASLGRPYFRTSNAPSCHQAGLGLGLAVAREILGRHGGRLWFESKLGQGTTVFLALPASDRRPAGDTGATPPGRAS